MTIKEMAYKLKEIREKKGISSIDISKVISDDRDYMRKIEEGIILPSQSDLYKICQCLSITVDDLFNEENDKISLIHKINHELSKYNIEELLKIYYMIKE